MCTKCRRTSFVKMSQQLCGLVNIAYNNVLFKNVVSDNLHEPCKKIVVTNLNGGTMKNGCRLT